jgi:MerR family Zn(II)-responsive transcriptional regulator of zntA
MLTIGKIAALADVTTDTLRYYEREGLIQPAGKSARL